MASEYKLKIDKEPNNYEKVEAEVEGVEGGKVVLLKVNDELRALGARCTHYGAPMVKGVITEDGRITCPWHGACFSTSNGDIENAPALDHLNSYPVSVKNGSVYITAEEAALKSGSRKPNVKCSPSGAEHVVVVGGGSGAIGAIEGLRQKGFKGKVTVLSKEGYFPIDRTKLSKALIPDAAKLQWRDEQHFKSAGVEFHLSAEVESVDFSANKLKTKDGKEWPYTKVIFASGGTPKRLPMKGFDLSNVFVLRTIDHVQNILKSIGDGEKKICAVGSSFIGMEVSKCLAGKGHKVTVVGMESTPMEKIMGPKLGKIFQRQLESSGVKFRLGASVDSAEASSSDPSKAAKIVLKEGDPVECDVVVLGVGVAPATEYLKNSGVQLEKDGSVTVDECFRIKGKDNAYAVGDIATYPYKGPGSKPESLVRVEHWNVAQNSGRQAALHIATQKSPTPFIPIFWSALGTQLRYCGATPEGYDDVVIKGKPDENTFAAYYTLGDEVVSVATMQSDPIMSQVAELMRRKAMPSKKEILEGVNVLEVKVPSGVRI